MKLNLQIQFTDKPDEMKQVVCNPSDMIKLETKYDISIASLEANIKITHLLFLAWASETRTKATIAPFDEWVDNIESISPADQQKK
jgi:hypothetical protein